jgi:hypothetical protein
MPRLDPEARLSIDRQLEQCGWVRSQRVNWQMLSFSDASARV